MSEKNIPSLRAIVDEDRATYKKARASWQILTIMAEFVEAAEYLSEIRPAVSILVVHVYLSHHLIMCKHFL